MTALLPALLGLAVVVAWVRLAVRRPGPAGRLAALVVLQPVVAGLLYLTLVPPRVASSGTLVIATRGATLGTALTGARLIALPEAPALPGAERVPDLGTALRRYPAARLRVVGEGLTPRDRDAAQGLGIDFAAPPAPRGVVGLAPPPPVAPGGAFTVGGKVRGGDAVDLIDPAGRRVDTAKPDAAGGFAVHGAARAAGQATFTLRVRDGTRVVETAAVPVWTAAAPPQRVLLIAGAPGPEVKYLRRWASDAGLAVHAEVATGAGLALGDAALPLTAATLARFDIAVFDARSWTALPPGTRAAVLGAVRNGLGLIVRVDGPPSDSDRGALRPLGFALAGGDILVPLALGGPGGDDAALAARRGPGTTDNPASVNRGAAGPGLARWNLTAAAPDATPLLRDAKGTPVAAWRAAGAGRIALWPVADSYALVLAGDGDRYAELWSAAFAALGRGHGGGGAVADGMARVGERIVLCRVAAGAAVVAPGGATSPLLADPAECAGFWPRVAGWHRVAPGTAAPFFVAADDALPNVRATADRDATRALAAAAPAPRATVAAKASGASWPWFFGWLAACALLWLVERAGRRGNGEHA